MSALPGRRDPEGRGPRAGAAARTALLALAVTGLAARPACAAPPPGERCEWTDAESAFTDGIELYGGDDFARAAPLLERATDLCPWPEGKRSVHVGLFGTYSYLPFYFLGVCRDELGQRFEALRQYYLSSCYEEPSRDEHGTMEGFDGRTRRCRELLRRSERPSTFDEFAAGLAAAGATARRWERAADTMWQALLTWEEDGGPTLPDRDRWGQPYLPRFHLAEALHQLGCQREACGQLERSVLQKGPLQEAKPEYEAWKRWEKEWDCAGTRGAAGDEPAICWRWSCWLGAGKPRDDGS